MKKTSTAVLGVMLMLLAAISASAQRDTMLVEPAKDGRFLIYPNPSPSSTFYVYAPYLECVSIRVYDMSHNEVSATARPDVSRGIMVVELAPGAALSGKDFWVVLTRSNGIQMEKLLIRR
jgi:hypothetical protein